MITVLRGGQVFSPACLGNKDILIVHGRIGAIASPGEIHISGTKVQEIDVSKKIIIPGFIDIAFFFFNRDPRPVSNFLTGAGYVVEYRRLA